MRGVTYAKMLGAYVPPPRSPSRFKSTDRSTVPQSAASAVLHWLCGSNPTQTNCSKWVVLPLSLPASRVSPPLLTQKKKKKQKYNPELQRKSLEGREQRLKDHEEFVNKLREYSKDSRPSTFPPSLPRPVDSVLTSPSLGCGRRSAQEAAPSCYRREKTRA